MHFGIYLCYFGTDGQSVDAAELFERASQSIKVKRFSDALDDLNAAIEADPALSEAYFKRASVLRHFCRYRNGQKVLIDLDFKTEVDFSSISLCYRYQDSENNYQKYLEFKSGDSNAEKELSQLHQAQSALETASTLYESKDVAKALEFVDKVVLVFSPACSKVLFLMTICNISLDSLIMQFLIVYIFFFFILGKASQSQAPYGV